jgi:hypothetical protein
MISVAPHMTLPRNRKGNVRRRSVEEQFRAEIDAMYASVSTDEVYAGVVHPVSSSPISDGAPHHTSSDGGKGDR